MTDNLPATISPDQQLISEIAMDIGKEAVSHLRTMSCYVVHRLDRDGNCGMISIRSAAESVKSEVVQIEKEGNRAIVSFIPRQAVEKMPRNLKTRHHSELAPDDQRQILLRLS